MTWDQNTRTPRGVTVDFSGNKVTIDVAGTYVVGVNFGLGSGSAHETRLEIYKNGAQLGDYAESVTTGVDTTALCRELVLSAADYLEVYEYHASGTWTLYSGASTDEYSKAIFFGFKIPGT